ncbi:MAG: hypothetical protein IIT39_05085 [Clostridia bacterium]|nr:hypothetical protein [Clostridia bacterium]
MEKTKNIFNYMLTDPENIDEKTIYEETGVNTDNVKALVMDKIHENKTTSLKKNHKKRWTISLIAAAAAVAVVGTTAAATGSFNSTFGQWFAGDMEGGMYAGGNVQFESEKLNCNFKGIAGDKSEVYAVMSLTKKDGSKFVENTNEYFAYSTIQNSNIDCTISLQDQIADKMWYFGQEIRGGEIYYQLDDENTMDVIIHYGSQFNIIGQTLTVNSTNNLGIEHIDEIALTANEVKAYWNKWEKLYEETSEIHEVTPEEDIFYQTGSKYDGKLNENQMLTFTPNGDWAVVTVIPIEMKYDLSVKLNYRDTTKNLPVVDGLTVNIGNKDIPVEKIEAQPLELNIQLSKDVSVETSSYGILNDVKVTLNDGKTYTSQVTYHKPSENSSLPLTLNAEFLEVSDKSVKKVVINPENIVKITFNDNVIYSK